MAAPMVRTSGIVTLVLVVASAVAIGVVVVRRAFQDRAGRDTVDCRGAIGVEVTGLSDAWRTRLAVPDHVRGAVITEVLPDSPARAAGLRVGDVVVAAGATDVTDACAGEFGFGRGCEPYDVTVHRGVARVTVTLTPVPEAELFEDACEEGVASACHRLAWITWHGSGVARDQDRALRMFDEACRGGSGAACAHLGNLFSGTPERRGEALSLLERACLLDDAQGCLLFASAFAMGTLAPRDDARATPIYEKACALGSALGCYNAGLMYNEGRGVVTDHARAFRAYAAGCAMGSTTACNDAAFMYQHGRGVAQDEVFAATLYERACAGTACQRSNLLGCLNLGKIHRDGIGVPRDSTRAAQIFRAICEQGVDPTDVDPETHQARACSLAGSQYLVGRGVDPDPELGLAFSTRGCDQGDGYGCFNAGVVHSRGLGVPPDEHQAMGFFRRACAAGDEEACDLVLRSLPSLIDAGEVREGDTRR